MAEIIEMGSLYLYERSAKDENSADNRVFVIGSTCKGAELSWVKVDDLLIATHNVCANISWESLNELGFIFGRPVWIDGKAYLCRSLKVGNDAGVANEWDAAIDATNERNSLWHWEAAYFWGQETSIKNSPKHVVRGFHSARSWGCCLPAYQHENIGFRPVLAPMVSEVTISDELIGCSIKAYGPSGVMSGILTSFSDYDLFLRSPMLSEAVVLLSDSGEPMASNRQWYYQHKNGDVVVAKTAVVLTQEV